MCFWCVCVCMLFTVRSALNITRKRRRREDHHHRQQWQCRVISSGGDCGGGHICVSMAIICSLFPHPIPIPILFSLVLFTHSHASHVARVVVAAVAVDQLQCHCSHPRRSPFVIVIVRQKANSRIEETLQCKKSASLSPAAAASAVVVGC